MFAIKIGSNRYVQWDNAQRKYNERINNVEQRIIAKLRDQLGTAESANEMFRIFARFNALFVRPSIKVCMALPYHPYKVERDSLVENSAGTRAFKVSAFNTPRT